MINCMAHDGEENATITQCSNCFDFEIRHFAKMLFNQDMKKEVSRLAITLQWVCTQLE